MKETRFITTWDYPGNFFDSQYGHVKYRVWLSHEQIRISGATEILEDDKGRIALAWK